MAQSKITLIGLEQFLDPNSVFDDLILPEGIDLDTLKGSIFLRCQEFELLYPDPEFMRAAVNVWGRKNYWTFDKWVKLINKNYDPLYNKDYYEDITDEYTGDYSKESSGTTSGSSSETSDYSRIDDLKTEDDTTITHAGKAYNDSDFVATSEDVTDGEIKNTGSQRNAGNTVGSTSGEVSGDESGEDAHTNTHTYHGYGNIGITSAQELFLKEADVARFNLYEQIADLFCQEFCIMVY